MAIKTSGPFTAGELLSELGKTGSFTAGDLRDLNGIGASGSFTAGDLRGKSVMSVSVGSDKTEYFTLLPGQRATATVKASVSGGESPYSYNWTKVSGSSGIGISEGQSGATVTLDAIMPQQDATYTATFRCTVNSQLSDDIVVTFNMIILDLNPDL